MRYIFWISSILVLYSSLVYGQQRCILFGNWLLDNHPNILVDYDLNKNIYQWRVLTQQNEQCQYHAIRNFFYMIHILRYPKFFDTIYPELINQNKYNEFAQGLKCTPESLFENHAKDILQKIRNYNLPCLLTHSNCLPYDSDFYAPRLSFYTIEVANNIQTGYGIAQDEFLEKAKKYIEQEGEQTVEEIEREAEKTASFAANSLEDIRAFYEHIKKAYYSYHYVSGIVIFIGDKRTKSVCLLIHQHHGKLEYLFADSTNTSFRKKERNYAYLPMSIIVDFVRDIKVFENCLSRFISIKYLELAKKSPSSQKLSALESAYNELKEFKLLDNNIYKEIYKPMYCQILIELKSQDIVDSKKVQGLLKNLACEKR